MRPTFALVLLASVTLRAADAVPSDSRFERRAALVAELRNEGAETEARAEETRLRADFPDCAAPTNAPAAAAHDCTWQLPSPGKIIAGGVVGFYRFFIGPAIGARCALEPSCSHYFVEASRKHGILGIPMIADRFVREPVVSAPDRPWVRTPAGTWRHPDPVEDHDEWF